MQERIVVPRDGEQKESGPGVGAAADPGDPVPARPAIRGKNQQIVLNRTTPHIVLLHRAPTATDGGEMAFAGRPGG